MKKKAVVNTNAICQTRIMAIRDSMEILSGKWKFHILGTLMQGGKLRFMDLQRELNGISAKILSKELQDLELNQLVNRIVLQTKPITVEYEISDFGKTLEPLIDEMAKWGTSYRQQLHQKTNRE